MGKHHVHDPKLAADVAAQALYKPNRDFFDYFPYSEDSIYALLQKLACPPPCVGKVDSNGWHRNCQKKASAAMEILGFSPRDPDPLPPRTDEEKAFDDFSDWRQA